MEGWGRDLGTRRCGPRRRRPPSPSVLSSPRQGAAEYEPRVVNQLLDFLYRYVSETLADADVREWERQSEGGAGRRGAHTSTPPLPSSLVQAFAESAGHAATGPTADDVALASAARDGVAAGGPPPAALLAALAAARNAAPLPPLARKAGLHPPPDADALLGQAYSVPPAPRAPPPADEGAVAPPPRGGRRPARRPAAAAAGNRLREGRGGESGESGSE